MGSSSPPYSLPRLAARFSHNASNDSTVRAIVGSFILPSAVSTTAAPAGIRSSSCSDSRAAMIPFGTLASARGRPTSNSNAAIASWDNTARSLVSWRAAATARIAEFTARPASSWFALRTSVTPRNDAALPEDRSTRFCAIRLRRRGRTNRPARMVSKKRRITTTAEAYVRTSFCS